MKSAYALLAASLALSACSPHGATSSAQAQAAPLPERDPGRFACATSADCMNSCRYGAVNRAWYTRNEASLRECQDGCASQVSGAPRCEEARCVAYYNGALSDGRAHTRRDECTRVTPRP